MIRSITLVLLAASLAATSAFAQVPSVQGQQPGTLPPAAPVIAPPPPVAPAPVPSVVTPLPSPSYGVPGGARRPAIGSSSVYRVQSHRPKKKKRPFKRPSPRVSDISIVRMI